MATLNIPNTFTAGTPAVATEVNSNFAAVKTFAEALSVGTNIDNGVITQAKLATAVVNRLVPVGAISAYAGTTAPTGWLMCDGTSTAGYPALAALVGATTPDMRGRFPIGDDAALTLLASGGSSTISVANLPAHSHANTASASTSVTVNSGGSHAHTATSDTQGSHAHGITDPGHYHMTTATGYKLFGPGNWVPSGWANDWVYNVDTAPAVTGISVNSAGAHNHGVTVDAGGSHSHSASASTSVTMSNANTGSGSAYLQPHLVVNFIIKHD